MYLNKHSFVISAYGISPYIENCIQSLLAQTLKSKIILATSTPSVYLIELATKYNLELLVNPQNTGIGNDWNFALGATNTQYVTIAHQDDIYASLYTEKVLKKMCSSQNNDVLIAFTNYWDLINNKIRENSLNTLIKNILLSPFLFSGTIRSVFLKKLLLIFGNPVSCPSVTFNKQNISGFHFSTEYSCALDWFAWFELSKRKGSFIYIKEKLVKHRLHLESETSNQISNGKRFKEEYAFFKMVWGKYPAKLLAKFYSRGYKDNEV